MRRGGPGAAMPSDMLRLLKRSGFAVRLMKRIQESEEEVKREQEELGKMEDNFNKRVGGAIRLV
jgi:hypothetical protein